MLKKLIFLHLFLLTKWSFFAQSATRSVPYVQLKIASILKLCRTFPNVDAHANLYLSLNTSSIASSFNWKDKFYHTFVYVYRLLRA